MDERRTHQRAPEEEPVKVHVVACPDNVDLEGRTFYCTSRDVSASGLRFCVHTQVTNGSSVEVEVRMSTPPDRYVHRGVVMWSQGVVEDGFNAYYLGVHINETLGNRQLAWRTTVEKKLRELYPDA